MKGTILRRAAGVWRATDRKTAILTLMMLACVALWLVIFLREVGREIGINKDWNYLFVCGQQLVHPKVRVEQISFVKWLTKADEDDPLLYRATMRANYCNNYIYPSISMYLAGHALSFLGVINPRSDFAAYLLYSMVWGIAVSGGLIGVISILVPIANADIVTKFSLASALAICAVLFLYVEPPRLSWILYQSSPAPPAELVTWMNVWTTWVWAWVNPGGAFSAFSAFARCSVAIIAFGAFGLRWSGRRGVAYWAPAVAALIHQSEASLLLGVILCCDLVIRPRSLLCLDCLVPIAVSLAIALSRDQMLSIMGLHEWALLVTVLAILLLIVMVSRVPFLRKGCLLAWRIVSGLRDRTIGAVAEPFSDAIVLLAIWFCLVPIVYVLSRNDAWYRLLYFWSELPPRYISLFQLPVCAGLVYPIWLIATKRRQTVRKTVAPAILSLVLIGVLTAATAQPWQDIEERVRRGRAYQAALRDDWPSTSDHESGFEFETAWYFRMAYRAVTGERASQTSLREINRP
jgi:hypothetical protein